MLGTVSSLSMAFMAVSCLVAFAIPVVLLIFFRKKKGADISPFFVGCGVMLLFALILESGAHQLIFSSAIGGRITGSVWLYAAYGGFMAGLFEETGRFFAFKTVLRGKRENDSNALMYGAGHGGFEAAVLLGFSMINNLVLSAAINNGSVSAMAAALSGPALEQLQAGISGLVTTPSYMFLLGSLERIFAVILQISLSVLVWFAAKNKARWYLYPLAVLIHFVVDALAVILSGLGVPALAMEAVIGLMTALTALFVKRTWNKNKT